MVWSVRSLGQSGLRLEARGVVFYVDPYLSDTVFRVEGEQGRRLRAVPLDAASIHDADRILITHEHLDHLDLATLGPMSVASQHPPVVVPAHLVPRLTGHCTAMAADVRWQDVADGVRFRAFRTSHPEPRNVDGHPWSVGYVIEADGDRVVVTGDTSLTSDLLEQMRPLRPVKVACLPVNERNFMRERAGIIGNMTVREALWLSEFLQAETLVPQHWDMFAANRAHREEIELLHHLEGTPVSLDFGDGDVRP